MKKFTLLLLCISVQLLYSCKTINIQGKEIKADEICDKCKPGNQGPVMVMYVNTFEPELQENSTPLNIAHNILGHVFPKDIRTGDINIPCSSNSVITPFAIEKIKPLGSTGTNGTSIDYSEKELLQLNVSATVSADLESITAANPSISLADLDEFKAKLTAAYSRFANKEITINGKYYQYQLEKNTVIELAKNINYSDCREYIYDTNNEKRMITALGLVYFDITSSMNSVDEIAASLAADAAAYGITFGVSAEFKKNISKNLTKATDGYFQVVVWRTVGVSDLERLI
jgi:hypothetical protein